MSLLSKPELLRLAIETAGKSGLDSALICAHIDVRTRWDSGFSLPTAISYLAQQNYSDPRESEWRSVQWGLMAISGEFARAEGYHGELSELLSPANNLKEGCRLFLRLAEKQVDSVRKVVESLVAWNRENNSEIARQTLLKLEGYRELIARMPEAQHTFQRDDTILPQEYLQISDNPLLEVGSTTHTRTTP
jgi:hypothetical protein